MTTLREVSGIELDPGLPTRLRAVAAELELDAPQDQVIASLADYLVPRLRRAADSMELELSGRE